MPSEFLTEHEVEVASAFPVEDSVEAVCPVNTHHANHREEDTHTETGRTFQIEWREVLNVGPRVTSLKECESVDCRCRLKHEREVQFHPEACVGVAFLLIWSELTIVVPAQTDGLCRIGVTARHSVATDVESLKR